MECAKSLLEKIPFGCKVIYIISLFFYIVGFIFPSVHVMITSVPYMTYNFHQYYRLFFSFFSSGASILSIICIIIDFLWIRFFFSFIEKTWSTAYFLTQIFIQNLILQIIFTIVAIIGIHIGIFETFTMSFGWSHLIIIFIFKITHKNELQDFKLFCIPIPKKYLSLIIIGVTFFYGFGRYLSFLIAVGLGFLQFSILKTHFIRFPLAFYQLFDKIMPKKVTERNDYVKVRNVQNQLDSQCIKCAIKSDSQDKSDNKNKKKSRKTANSANQAYDLNQQIQRNPSGVQEIAGIRSDSVLA